MDSDGPQLVSRDGDHGDATKEEEERNSKADLFQRLNENLTQLVVFLSGSGPVYIPPGVLCEGKHVVHGVSASLCKTISGKMARGVPSLIPSCFSF